MEALDNAGHAVLHGYGYLLDSIVLNFESINHSFISSNVLFDPVGIQVLQEEHSFAHDSILLDDCSLVKLLASFSSICYEINLLKIELEVNFLYQIIEYDENVTEEPNIDESKIIFLNFLPVLIDIHGFVQRCQQVLINFIIQLFLYVEHIQKKDSQNNIHLKFLEISKYLEDLLLIFITLDAAFSLNDGKIMKHLNILRQYVKLFPNDLDKADISKAVYEIYEEMLSGHIFEFSMKLLSEKKMFSSNDNFHLFFNRYLRKKLSEVENLKENDLLALKTWSQIVASHVFLIKCFGIKDKKLNKNILETSKKFLTVPLFGNLIWIPSKFLNDQIENKTIDASIKHFGYTSLLEKRLDQLEQNSTKDVKSFSFLIFKWTLQMGNAVSTDATFSRLYYVDLAQLSMEGLNITEEIKFYVDNILQLHGLLGRPMTRMLVLNLCKLIELLKCIQSVFNRHYTEICKKINHIFQKRVMQVLTVISKVKKESFKNNIQEKYKDSYSSLLLVEKILFGSCSTDKILLIRLALSLSYGCSPIDNDDSERIFKYINEIYSLCLLTIKFEKLNFLNFMYIEENVFPIYFKHLMDSHSYSTRLQYILQYPSSKYGGTENGLMERKKLFRNKVIKELYEEIEIHLRLHAHSHLKDDTYFDVINKDYSVLLHNLPISFYKWFINIKGLVESYLNKTFYDLTTIALHDWQTYSEMKSLAEHQFQLKTLQDNLPSQTISQGLDILEIMRNIHVFVSKYLYNLNTQCFIEYRSSNKHLNTVKIPEIANSIWTHGTGIMNTTVNFIYQFLRKKLLKCSQFLYDEHINSRLSKDFKYFNQQKLLKNSMYSYERAEKFNKGISRLKILSDEYSYLDQYRILISQIGNALGYVRMIHSGGLHHSVASINYFPFNNYISVSGTENTNGVYNAFENFEITLLNALHNLNGDTDALKLLVEVFRSVFHSPENEHLRLFVMIIPPLTINFINYIIAAKEKISKRNSLCGVYSDDGFVIGVAYLLSVFNLNEEFNSLHWFESVTEKFFAEENNLYVSTDQQEKDDCFNDNTLKLAFKRIQIYRQEFKLLQCNLNSAMAFFSEDVPQC